MAPLLPHTPVISPCNFRLVMSQCISVRGSVVAGHSQRRSLAHMTPDTVGLLHTDSRTSGFLLHLFVSVQTALR